MNVLLRHTSTRVRSKFCRSMACDIQITRMTGSLGAELSNVRLDQPISKEDGETIRQALFEHGVIGFRDVDFSNADHLAFANLFGEADFHPIVKGKADFPEIIEIRKNPGKPATFGEIWHSDNSFLPEPSMATVLHGKVIPPYGNDTVFANMQHVYDLLSPGMKDTLSGLKAVHSASRAFAADNEERKTRYDGKAGDVAYQDSDALTSEMAHPVVRTHPETGKKSIYVNSMFTLRFEGWTEEESQPLLQYLFDQVKRPEVQARFRWQTNSVLIWDNRMVQHQAISDTPEFLRVLNRITVKGDTPF